MDPGFSKGEGGGHVIMLRLAAMSGEGEGTGGCTPSQKECVAKHLLLLQN